VSYRVFWAPHAEQQLDAILRDQAVQRRVAAAARHIDLSLAKNPANFGESKHDTVRIAFELPLGVHFEVLEDVRTVIVYHVWRTDRNPPT
jgi:plasmid stabilization system protein ParE